MLVVKAIGAGAASAVAAIVLYVVVVAVIPMAVALAGGILDGGGIAGFSVSIESGMVVAAAGFLIGFGWTLLHGRAAAQAPR